MFIHEYPAGQSAWASLTFVAQLAPFGDVGGHTVILFASTVIAVAPVPSGQ